jgi:putative membrane protein
MANTSLIVISGVFLLIGYYFIRRYQREMRAIELIKGDGREVAGLAARQQAALQKIELHKRSMLTATVFAALFLVVYVTRAMLFETRLFAGEGLVRAIYLFILITHTILAILVGPFALVTLRRALRGEYARHRRVARITFPMWLYVVVTGWLVYWMLSTHTNVTAY